MNKKNNKKNRKGTVGVEVDRGWLRLRMPRSYERRYIYLNLPDEPEYRAIAHEIAQREQERIFQRWGESFGLDFLSPQS